MDDTASISAAIVVGSLFFLIICGCIWGAVCRAIGNSKNIKIRSVTL